MANYNDSNYTVSSGMTPYSNEKTNSSNGNMRRNNDSFAQNSPDTLPESNSSNIPDTKSASKSLSYYVSEIISVSVKIWTCILAFIAGFVNALPITGMIWFILWLMGFSLAFVNTYKVIALVSGILIMIKVMRA